MVIVAFDDGGIFVRGGFLVVVVVVLLVVTEIGQYYFLLCPQYLHTVQCTHDSTGQCPTYRCLGMGHG